MVYFTKFHKYFALHLYTAIGILSMSNNRILAGQRQLFKPLIINTLCFLSLNLAFYTPPQYSHRQECYFSKNRKKLIFNRL